jgi:uncharacterized protein DUF3455
MQTKPITLVCAVLIALIGAGSVRGAQHVVPPPVPGELEVDGGHVPYLMMHAVGTQNQICLPRTSGVGLGWTLWGPQATIYDGRGEQILTHYLSANPEEGGVLRATWRHSRDTSTVWAFATATSSDGNYVEPGAIAWLRLQVVGAEDGPTGGDRLSRTTFIQRVNTVGGMAPPTDCAPLGAKLFVPYEADYVFYKKQGPDAQ